MTAVVVLLIAVAATLAVGLALRARAGRVRASEPAATAGDERTVLLTEAGVTATGHPVVLHFSADWCGPCAAVRRVVGNVLAKLDASRTDGPAALDIELDIDENPALAKTLGVLSLPTTFILDGDLTERFRISGVPSAADLEAALVPLLETE
ncbi:co-chaperone YbbN [Prescottella sp. R16]|uniref:thioredoxin family protein n=1 Tax=Prescottella sp. R16 TaxID=3064529 RepID=UPI00272DF86B|nr:thioredoxin family protein [Prescottella sp. R16]